MKLWSVVFVVVISAFLLASCGKAGEASKAVAAPGGSVSCKQYCQAQTPGECTGKWKIEGDNTPNCKCTWECSGTPTQTSTGVETPTTPTSDASRLWTEDRQVAMSVADHGIKDGVVMYNPSDATTRGDLLLFSGPALKTAEMIKVYKQSPKGKAFTLAVEAPVEMANGEYVAAIPLWGSDAGKKITFEVVNKNGVVISNYKGATVLTVVPEITK